MTLTLKELGEQLRQARDSKGLSLKEAAQITKIGPRILEAFEQGDRDKFPHPVYAKGFVKNYASLLGVDPGECGRAMAQALDTPRQTAEPERGAPVPLVPHTPMAVPSRDKDKRSSLPMILALLAMVGVLAVLVWYLFLAPGASSSEEQAGQEPGRQETAVAHQETGAQDDQGQSIPGQNPSAAPIGQAGEQAVVEAGADLGDMAPQAVPALPPGTHRLEIRAQDEQGSWIGVYALEPDPATGLSVLLKDYTVTGTGQLTLTLTEPHNYRFGRIQGVAVSFDGQPVDTPGEGTRNLVFPPRQ